MVEERRESELARNSSELSHCAIRSDGGQKLVPREWFRVTDLLVLITYCSIVSYPMHICIF